MSDSSVTKVPCIQCSALILPLTAKKWGGLCGWCETRREQGFPPPNMKLSLSKKRRNTLQNLAQLIFGDDQDSVDLCSSAFDDWKAFYDGHRSHFPHFNTREGSPSPLDMFFDIADLKGHTFEVDHREFASEVVIGVSKLRRARSLTTDWEPLVTSWKETESGKADELDRVLHALGQETAKEGLLLIELNKCADTNPVALIAANDLDDTVTTMSGLKTLTLRNYSR